MDLGSLVVTIDGNNSGLDRALKDSTSKVDAAIGQIVGAIGLGAAAWKGMDLAIQGIKFNSMMETAQTSFGIMLGSVDQAKAKLGELKYLADHSNLTFSGLTSATTTLLQFGVAGNEVVPIVRMLGEVAGGDSQKLQQLALVMGQVSSAGKLQGGDLLQLVNAGFNPLNTIAEKTGESMTDLRKRMSDGAISAQEVKDAFKTATSEGGLFFGMMENNSKTLAGSFSTLGDATDTFLGRTTEAFSGPLLFGVQQVTNLLNIIPGQFSGIALAVGTVTAGVGAFALGVGALTPAFAALGVTINISLLPLLGVTATITAIVAAIGVMGNELHKVNQGAISEMKSNFGEILSSTERGKRAIDDVAQSALAAHGVFNSWVNNGAEFNLALERTSEHLELSKTQVAALLANSKDVTRENRDLAIQYLAQNGLSKIGLTQQQEIAKAAKEYAEYNKDALAAFLERNPKLKEEYDLRQKLSETAKAEKTAQEEYFARMKNLNDLIAKNVISETDGYNEKIRLREEYASGLRKDLDEHKVSLDFVATETQRIKNLNNDDRNTLAEKATVARNLTTALNEQLVVDLGLKTARKDSFGLLRESNDFVLTTNANLGIQSDLLKDQDAPLSSIVAKHEEVKGIFSLEPTMLEKVTAEINSQPLAIDAVNTELRKQTPLITSTWDVLVKSKEETVVFTEKVTALSMAVDKVKQEFKTWDEVFSQVMVDGLHSVEKLIGDGFVALGKSIGHSLVGLKQDDLWQSFAQAATRSIAKVIEGLGQQLIAMAAVHLLMGDFAGAALAGAAAAGAFVASGVLQGLADGMTSVKDATKGATEAVKSSETLFAEAEALRAKSAEAKAKADADWFPWDKARDQAEADKAMAESNKLKNEAIQKQEEETRQKMEENLNAIMSKYTSISSADIGLINEQFDLEVKLAKERGASAKEIAEIEDKRYERLKQQRALDLQVALSDVEKKFNAEIETAKKAGANNEQIAKLELARFTEMEKVREKARIADETAAYERRKAKKEELDAIKEIENEKTRSHNDELDRIEEERNRKAIAARDEKERLEAKSISDHATVTEYLKKYLGEVKKTDLEILEEEKKSEIEKIRVLGASASEMLIITEAYAKKEAEILGKAKEDESNKARTLAEKHLAEMIDISESETDMLQKASLYREEFYIEMANSGLQKLGTDQTEIWAETLAKVNDLRLKAQDEAHAAELKAEQEHLAVLDAGYKKTGDSLASSLTDAMKRGTSEADWTSSIMEMFKNMTIDAAILAGGFADRFKAIGKQIQDAISSGLSGDALSGIKNQIGALFTEAKQTTDQVSALFADIGAGGTGAGLTIPAFARGTISAPGGIALVGERGPELVNLPRGSSVLPAYQTRQAISGGNKSISISVQSNAPLDPIQTARIVRDTMESLAFQGVM